MQLPRMRTALVGALELPRAPQHPGVGGLSSAAPRDKINAEGGREGFLTGTLWEKQNLMSWFTNCPPNDIPKGAGQAS